MKEHTVQGSDPALPKLRVPREEAREKITAQRKKGNQILLSLTSASKVLLAFKATLEKAKSDQGKWAIQLFSMPRSLTEEAWLTTGLISSGSTCPLCDRRCTGSG